MTRASDTLPRTVGRHYRIESRVGSGGMGMVYRGTDLRLNRPVAVKAIHDSRLKDGGAGRLRAEAVAAAAIDHPYICKVYELIEEDDENYLVMEFVEGETLSHILRRGMPALMQTVQWAGEIAEALAMAHARGIVHRDVKPSNVMITGDSHVKLLDFGLAREDVVAMPFERTRTSPSDQSAYAGTPQYMSPEQAAGHPVTTRADLFSLGVLIFECLTGKLPFQGTSPYDYVRHLLSDNPRRLDRLAPEAPADLVRLVELCLEKTPADRPESAAAVHAELRRIAASLTSPGRPFDTSSAVRAKRRWRATATVVAGLAMALVVWQLFFTAPPADPLRRARALVTWPSEETDSRVSPDGRWVSFESTRSGTSRLYVQAIDGTDATPIDLPAGRVIDHAWSPDGNQIACSLRRPDGQLVLQVVPAFFGGEPIHTLTVDGTGADVLRWIGRRLFVLSTFNEPGQVLQAADLDSGTVTGLSQDWDIDGTLVAADVSPDGRRAVVSILSGGRQDLWLTPLDAWRPARLTDDEFYEHRPVWNGTGASILYATNRGGQDDLWEIVLASGRQRPITSSHTGEEVGGISADGRVITFEQNADEASLWLVDPAAPAPHRLTADTLKDMAPAMSADGSRLVFQRSRTSPSEGHAIFDARLFTSALAGSALRPEPRGLADGFAGSPSPDGTHVAYLRRGDLPGRGTLVVQRVDTGDVEVVSTTAPLPIQSLLPLDWAEQLVAWSRDGGTLYYVDQAERHSVRAYRLGETPAAASIPGAIGTHIRDLHVSPDGRRLAFLEWTDGEFALHVIELGSGDGEVVARFRESPTRLFGRGWLPDSGRFVLSRTLEIHGDRSADLEVLVADLVRGTSTAARVTTAFNATSRLDPARPMLYVTRIEDGVHNIFAVSIGDGVVARVTDNTLPGVTFSGIVPLGDGRVIAAQSIRRQDIWVLEESRDRDEP